MAMPLCKVQQAICNELLLPRVLTKSFFSLTSTSGYQMPDLIIMLITNKNLAHIAMQNSHTILKKYRTKKRDI